MAGRGEAPPDAVNRHLTVVEIDGTGIAIRGPSGTGKTSLALGLVERASEAGLAAHFICDDQTLLSARRGVLHAFAPPAIAGRVEIRGYGIVEIDHKPETAIGLVVELVDDHTVERMPDERRAELLGIGLPLLRVPRRHEAGAARIVLAWLRDHSG